MRAPSPLLILLVILLFVPAGCRGVAATHRSNVKGDSTMSFALTTTAFSPGGEIPARYTCSGANLSPALAWTDVPAGARSLALIADDPDAPMGTWTHWLVWNLPARDGALPEGVPSHEVLANGARQGTTDFRRIGYGGPCPPPGRSHHYFFTLYALDASLNLMPGSTRSELEAAMKPHVLAKAEVMGTFRR